MDGWQQSRFAALIRAGKYESHILAVCGPKFLKPWHSVGDPQWFSTVDSTLFYESICHYASKSSKKRPKVESF